ncbi:hypothetical protein AB1Y20_001374 [Prymnesium parvum]|uniref:Tyr recombinase domain-containing protein n=1 Tax=Prymnesium parvum TaxID=97485 RepID=A0AB34KAW1_PRYPA
MGRQDSCVSLLREDHGVDHQYLWLRLTEKQKRSSRFRRIVRIPIARASVRGHASVIPALATVARAFVSACLELPGKARCTHFFQLPGEPPPVTASMSAWLEHALRELGIAAPAGLAYLGHSLRSGASSAAEAIRVSRFRGNWLGAWVGTEWEHSRASLHRSFFPGHARSILLVWLAPGRGV